MRALHQAELKWAGNRVSVSCDRSVPVPPPPANTATPSPAEVEAQVRSRSKLHVSNLSPCVSQPVRVSHQKCLEKLSPQADLDN